jgi:hypothetical protein
MGETSYGKCRNLSVKWEFSKITQMDIEKSFPESR